MFGVERAVIWTAVTLCILQIIECHTKEWYKTTSIYEVYTRSFKDSDGDGIGDIKGIHEKLDYIQSVGFETIWVQTILKSPMKDMGYDISDFKDVDPLFGTLDDLKSLVQDIHKRGMKIMLDFVPNHTSNLHEWFLKSVNKVEPYTDFYVWQSPNGYDPITKQPIPPNNWLSVFGDSIWEWNENRKQFYLHQFVPAQPDLNYRNPVVKEAMKDVLRFWLDLGIDGFRVDAIVHLVEDALLRDNPWRSPEVVGSKNYGDQIHKYSIEQEETYQMTHEWRLLLDEYKAKDNHSRILAYETYQPPNLMRKFFGNETYPNMHFPLNIATPIIWFGTRAASLNNATRDLIDNLPTTGTPSWIMSDHDLPRMASRSFPEFSEAAFMIELLFPGVVSIYYGEEIRMLVVYVRPDQIKDPAASKKGAFIYSRDISRTPMQWDDSQNAGFTKKKVPWLPVNPDYWTNNVKKQMEEPKSHLKTVKRLMLLRQSPVIKDGQFVSCALTEWLFMFKRSLDSEPPIIVIVNLGTELETVSLNDCAINISESLAVHTASLNSGFNTGDKFTICNTNYSEGCSELRPKAGVVLTLPTSSSSSHSGPLSHSFLVPIIALTIISFFRCNF